jgi:hypothetical protein
MFDRLNEIFGGGVVFTMVGDVPVWGEGVFAGVISIGDSDRCS